jgi:hypothetical protein
MPSNSNQPGTDGQPYNLTIQTGQTVLLHNGTKIIQKVTVTKPVRYFTSYLSFVGTLAQVDAKIAQLNLK